MSQMYRKDDEERLELHRQNLKGWKKEINDTFDKNLEEKLHKAFVNFTEKYDMEECEAMYFCRKLLEEIKKELKND